MRPTLFLLYLFAIACTGCKSSTTSETGVEGDWLILYPDHKLKTVEERLIYGKAQDSIVGLSGLKTVSFQKGGVFVQADSIFGKKGKWSYASDGSQLLIAGGGKGFGEFSGTVKGGRHDTLLIEEMIPLQDKSIRVVWHLKRLSDKKMVEALLSEKANAWRKTGVNETDEQVKEKLKSMLLYYSAYFDMVSKESAYFIGMRSCLPFNYYQHSIGLKRFDQSAAFISRFSSTEAAAKAHVLLTQAFARLEKEDFPSGKNFVIEYSLYMKQLAGKID